MYRQTQLWSGLLLFVSLVVTSTSRSQEQLQWYAPRAAASPTVPANYTQGEQPTPAEPQRLHFPVIAGEPRIFNDVPLAAPDPASHPSISSPPTAGAWNTERGATELAEWQSAPSPTPAPSPQPAVDTAPDEAIAPRTLPEVGNPLRGTGAPQETATDGIQPAVSGPAERRTALPLPAPGVPTLATPPSAPQRLSPAELPAAPSVQPPMAETPASATSEAPAAAPLTTLDESVTAENIKAAIEQVEAVEGIDDAQRTELLGLLDQAAKWLGNAKEYTAKAAQYQTEVQAVPQQVAEATGMLEKPLPDPAPVVAADATLVQLEQQLGQAEEEAKTAQAAVEQAKAQLDAKSRADRLAELGKLKEGLKGRVQEAEDHLKSLASVEGPEQVAAVRRIEAKARKDAAQRQLELVDAERQRLESLSELLPLQRDLAQRRLAWSEKHVAALRDIVADFRKRESERQAAEARRIASQAHPALRDLAESNARLAEQRTALAEEMERVAGYKEQVGEQLTALRDEYKDVTKKVKVAGMTPTVGLLLQNRRGHLPDVGFHRQKIKYAGQSMRESQVTALELEEERSQLADFDQRIEQAIAEIGSAGRQFAPGYLQDMVGELMHDRRTYLNSLIGDYQTYQGDLNELDLDTRALLTEAEQYRAFIDEHVLWTPSSQLLSLRDVTDSRKALVSFLDVSTWRAVGASLVQNLMKHPLHSVVFVLCCVGLFVFRSRMLSRLEWLGERVADEQALSIVPTLQALVLTVLLASLGPLMLWGAGWWLALNAEAPDLARGLSSAFQAISLSYFVAEIFRQVCRPNGLADKHFGWPAEVLPVMFRSLNWLVVLALPMLFVVSLFAMHDEGAWKDSLGRLAFLTGLAVLSVYLHYLLRPRGGVLQAALARSPVGAGQRLRWVWYGLGVGIPLALGVLIVLGYSYSVDQLMSRLGLMVCLVLTVLLAQAVARRTLSVAWKRVSLLRAARQPETLSEAGEEVDEGAGGLAEEEVVDRQLGQFVRWAALLTFGVCAWMVWSDMFPALQVLNRVELWPTTVVVKQTVELADGTKDIVRESKTVPVTLAHLIVAVVALIASIAAAKTLPGLLEFAVLARLPIDKGARNACVMLSRYAVTLVGLIVAFRMMGMTWSSVQWLAAAMTVGLGFGLQEIFANLVSGLIILFERPIRIGDLVTVNGTTGKVTRMQIRATTITDFDRRELIVPNKRFITDDVVNWTLSDPITRFVVPVGISYNADPSEARELLLDVARRHPLVLVEPAPSAIFLAFGDSTLNLELRAYIGSRDDFGTVLHEVNVAIERTFRQAGIEIAFPQQDLHIRTVNGLSVFAPPATEGLRKAA